MNNTIQAIADSYYSKSDFKRALQKYLVALSEDNSNIQVNERIAECYLKLGKLEEARRVCRSILEMNARRPMPYYILGLISEKEGQLMESQEALSRAVELDSHFVAAHNSLGVILARQGNLDKSTRYLNKAIELDPILWKAHFNLATTLRAQGLFSQALEENMNALRLAPSFRTAYWTLVSSEFKYSKYFGIANLVLLSIILIGRSLWLIPIAALLIVVTVYRASIWFQAGRRVRGFATILVGLGAVLWYLYRIHIL